MSTRTLLVGSLGLVAAVWACGACFLVPQPFVSANPVDSVEAEAAAPVAVAQADLLTQAAPPTTIRRPREATLSTPRAVPEPLGLELPPETPRLPSPIAIPDSLDPFGAPQPATTVAPVVETPVDAAAVDPAPLRRELLQLLGEKADLLTVPQLQAAIIRTEREIRELKAQDRLEQLRHELEILSRQYPQTWGGDAAQKLFNVPLPTGTRTGDEFNAPVWKTDPNQINDPFAPGTPTPVRRKSS
ncbi:MAG: hypothetical protein SH850_10670 [Planctomycetaceae bacterium]|nr:hypothetical protein [Planctomycetaceae bacterium]